MFHYNLNGSNSFNLKAKREKISISPLILGEEGGTEHREIDFFQDMYDNSACNSEWNIARLGGISTFSNYVILPLCNSLNLSIIMKQK